jgi:hypothetical protein
MTQTLIHIIPYLRHYTGIAQNISIYIPYTPHSNHHQNSINTKQAPYKRLTSITQHTEPQHAKRRTGTAGASKKKNEYT